MRQNAMRITERLNVRAMGISNAVYDKNCKYSVQFYDYDKNGEAMNKAHLKQILEIFPYDCIIYETKHGIHFISFSLLKGSYTTKARAVKTSKEIGNQDYWTQAKDLTLRISAKWKLRRFRKKRLTISKKPIFKGLIKSPNKYRISNKHLEFYFKYMNLPEEIYDLYQDCVKKDFKIKIYHYKTRD